MEKLIQYNNFPIDGLSVHHSRVDKVAKAIKFKVEQPITLNRSMLTTRGRVLTEAEWTINENCEVK